MVGVMVPLGLGETSVASDRTGSMEIAALGVLPMPSKARGCASTAIGEKAIISAKSRDIAFEPIDERLGFIQKLLEWVS
jgi:hypothetical protein